MARLTAFTSSSSVVSGMGAAVTLIPACCRPVMTRLQLDPSAHAPWTSMTVGLGCTTQKSKRAAVQRSTGHQHAIVGAEIAGGVDDDTVELTQRVQGVQ